MKRAFWTVAIGAVALVALRGVMKRTCARMQQACMQAAARRGVGPLTAAEPLDEPQARGTTFSGSRKGSAATVTGSVPSTASASRAVPGSASSIGTQA